MSPPVRMSWVGSVAVVTAVVSSSPVPAAIVVAATSSNSNTNQTSLTVAHTVAAGSNRLLVVGIGIRRLRTVTSVTYGGVALTRLQWNQSGSQCTSELWYLKAPAEGAADVVITHDGSGSMAMYGVATSFTGVDQTNPIDAQGGATGSTTGTQGVSVTTVTAGAMLMDVIVRDDYTPSLVVGSGQTARMNLNDGITSAGGSSTEGPVAAPGSVAMEWDIGASTEEFAISAVSLKPAASRRIMIVH